MRIALALSLALVALALPAFAQEIYKTVDADGNVVYTDQPPTPEAEPMDLPPLIVADPFEAVPVAPREEQQPEEMQLYEGIELSAPQVEQHFWGTGGALHAQVAAPHALRPGDTVNFYLDGSLAGNARAYGMELSEVHRGEHTVHAEIVDAGGRVLTRTPGVVFFMHQQSVQHPNNPRKRGGG